MAVQPHPNLTRNWTVPAIALVAVVLATVVVTKLMTGGTAAAPYVEQPPSADLNVPLAPAVPRGLITYEITGKGTFVADGAGITVREGLSPEGTSDAAPKSGESIVSPDGLWTASAVDGPDGSVQLALTGVDGSRRTVWSLAGPEDAALVAAGKVQARAVSGIPLVMAWSPDSSTLAFGSITGEPYTLGLLRSPGSAQPSLSFREVHGGYVGELAWSPDGSKLGISTYSLDRLNHTVLVLDAFSGLVRSLSDGCHVTWSPDSAYVAVHRDPGDETGAWIIAATDFTTRWPITREAMAFPLAWSES